ncbi:pyrimidine/purine nucleoside phosphorylase [Alphaproteobacteria bacterium]|nr:pyrimidine/purine nucleoside phosphorylase [Alphaproteobacteria bacterium]
MNFKNVTVDLKSNVYFDGKVTSRNILFEDGSIKTLGLMLEGEYEFNTSQKEIMEITTGELNVLLKGESEWKIYKEGSRFEVPAISSFKVKVNQDTNYCCSYIDTNG